jgi:hypothetical protein
MRAGVHMNEFLLYNAVNDIDMLSAIIQNCKHVIKIRSGIIFTVLRQNYKDKRDTIKYLLETCKVSNEASIGTLMLDAIHHGDMEMVRFICHNWDMALTTPLVVAAKECQYDILRFIFNRGSFEKNTLDVALCDTVYTKVELLSQKQQLIQIVSFLLKNGATASAPLLKLCAYQSKTQNDFTVLTTLLTFYNLHDIVRNVEDYALHGITPQMWLNCVADAFRLQKTAQKIVHVFRVRRRLHLARCIYRMNVYSPQLVYIIAKTSNL